MRGRESFVLLFFGQRNEHDVKSKCIACIFDIKEQTNPLPLPLTICCSLLLTSLDTVNTMVLPSLPPSLCLLLLAFLFRISQLHAFSSVHQSSFRSKTRAVQVPRRFGFNHESRGLASVQLGVVNKKEETDQAAIPGLETLLSSSSNDNAGFVNDIIAGLWENVALAGRSMILSRLEPRFAILPGSLNTLRFSKIDLGKIPCHVSNFAVNKTINGDIKCDFDVVWNGECEIQLTADYTGSIGVRAVQLEGRMTILFKPQVPILPAFKAFHFAFIDPPRLELEFTDGLSQIKNVAAIDKLLQKAIQDFLAEMMVLPVRISYNIFEQDEDKRGHPDYYSFLDSYEFPLGIARVAILCGRGFKVKQGRIEDIPDVYCEFKLGTNPVWRTSTVRNSLEPAWKEEFSDFLLSDPTQEIRIQAWNENLDENDNLGYASVTVDELLSAGKSMELELEQDNKGTGAFITLACETSPLVTDLSSLDREQNENLLCGALVILVTRAFDIPLSREEAQTYVKVTYLSSGSKKEFYTGTITDYRYYGADAINPTYDCAFHVPLTTKMMKGDSVITFDLVNEDSVIGTPLGSTTFSFTPATFDDSPDKTITEKRTVGEQGAALEFSVCLRGLELDSSQATTTATTTSESTREESASFAQSTGTVRITAVKGRGFKTPRLLSFFRKKLIPDVYCNFKLPKTGDAWRTSTIRNATSPEWNESKNFALVDDDHIVSIDVFDAGRGIKPIGSAATTIAELLAEGTMDVEIQRKGKGCGAFITLGCDAVE